MLGETVIQQIFAAGLTLQSAADLTAEPEVRRRVDASVEDLDQAVRTLRDAVFGLKSRARPGGLRQQILGLCRELSPVPELSFNAETEGAVSAQVQAQILGLLRQSFNLIGADRIVPGVDVSVAGDACLVTIDASSRDHQAEELGSGQDFSELLARARKIGVGIDAEIISGGIRLGWRLPLDQSARPAAQG
jgi:hypothetical protein